MMRNHFLGASNGGEVVHLVPLEQQLCVLQQGFRLVYRHVDTHGVGRALKRFCANQRCTLL